ncbi:MAG: dihydrofolate reductase family protein [Gemmatimonadaceae bacterium]|nr:dihydrofolate reductase family protein [Gemmatimonadaceae bacterium]
MRTLVYAMDVTLDGFIARDDGTCEALSCTAESAAHRAVAAGDVDCVVTGRVAFEARVRDGLLRTWPALHQVVVTQTLHPSAVPGVQLLGADVASRIRDLKASAGATILLAGGAELATTLMRHGLIDELSLCVHPVVFGSGIGLFTEGLAGVPLVRRQLVAGAAGRIHLRHAVVSQRGAVS